MKEYKVEDAYCRDKHQMKELLEKRSNEGWDLVQIGSVQNSAYGGIELSHVIYKRSVG